MIVKALVLSICVWSEWVVSGGGGARGEVARSRCRKKGYETGKRKERGYYGDVWGVYNAIHDQMR